MACKTCTSGDEVYTICRCCQLVSGDRKVKKCKKCEVCGVYLCSPCETAYMKRILAAGFSAFIKIFKG